MNVRKSATARYHGFMHDEVLTENHIVSLNIIRNLTMASECPSTSNSSRNLRTRHNPKDRPRNTNSRAMKAPSEVLSSCTTTPTSLVVLGTAQCVNGFVKQDFLLGNHGEGKKRVETYWRCHFHQTGRKSRVRGWTESFSGRTRIGR